jgi:hypothetical protein
MDMLSEKDYLFFFLERKDAHESSVEVASKVDASAEGVGVAGAFFWSLGPALVHECSAR